MDRINFIHIPKTGGTALTSALNSLSEPGRFVIHDHSVTLRHVPAGEKVLFSIREPISRCVSAFNSRLRKGRPRYDIEWTPIQRRTFQRFATCNDMAEALSCDNADDRRLAAAFLKDTLLAAPLANWLISECYVFERHRDIVGILRQESLSDDFERLKAALGLPKGLRLPDDPVESHRTPPSFSRRLSEIGRRNLEAWYADDLVLYEAVCNISTRTSRLLPGRAARAWSRALGFLSPLRLRMSRAGRG